MSTNAQYVFHPNDWSSLLWIILINAYTIRDTPSEFVIMGRSYHIYIYIILYYKVHGVGDDRTHDLRGFRLETRTYNIIWWQYVCTYYNIIIYYIVRRRKTTLRCHLLSASYKCVRHGNFHAQQNTFTSVSLKTSANWPLRTFKGEIIV